MCWLGLQDEPEEQKSENYETIVDYIPEIEEAVVTKERKDILNMSLAPHAREHQYLLPFEISRS